jgi:Zn ribbon nucleic-acid-binding protein
MGKAMCPGQDTAFWRPGDIYEVPCSQCGHELEFFKDDVSRRCTGCGSRVQNPKLNLGCAQWCEHAKQCLGYDPKEVMLSEGEDTTLVDKLIDGLKAALKGDQDRVSRALTVLEQAKEVLSRRGPDGLDPKVVLTAALLSDLEPGQAREVMDGAGLHWESADRVEALLRGEDPESQEALVRADAQRLADLPDPAAMATAAGRELAQALAARAGT